MALDGFERENFEDQQEVTTLTVIWARGSVLLLLRFCVWDRMIGRLHLQIQRPPQGHKQINKRDPNEGWEKDRSPHLRTSRIL